MTTCHWCGHEVEGEGHHTDIGTLCDECEAFMVPHYCPLCDKASEVFVSVRTDTARDGTPIYALACPSCAQVVSL